MHRMLIAVGVVFLAVACPAQPSALGWKPLFDGTSTAGWRGYRKPGFPEKGWRVEDGTLRAIEKGGGGDIITTDMYADFDLEFEFKLAKGANSGVMFRVTEKHDASWQTGPEYQVYDDSGAEKPPKPITSAGALYDLYEPAKEKTLKPAGEWNAARIRLRGGWLEHWLNGVRIVDCRMDSEDFKKRVAASKFAKLEGFATEPKGHIALQDHGNDVWYRNIRIRDLSTPLKGERDLFNGRDLSGWTAHLNENGKPEDVWSIVEGVLVCKGNPVGYIRTNDDFTNYVLKLEWRFNPVTKKTGNSGVLLRMIGPDKVWPRSVEAQLQHENAGDFWNIDEFPMKTEAARLSGRNTKKTHMAERPIGEWNEYEIVVQRGDVTLNVNGQTLNRAWNVQETPGKIGLQSEGSEIHFRNIRIAPLE
jgi:Domain of Unknown Function (DUF1080)